MIIWTNNNKKKYPSYSVLWRSTPIFMFLIQFCLMLYTFPYVINLLFQAGMILDNGVKTTKANDKDKRPFLSLVGARSDPAYHLNP